MELRQQNIDSNLFWEFQIGFVINFCLNIVLFYSEYLWESKSYNVFLIRNIFKSYIFINF